LNSAGERTNGNRTDQGTEIEPIEMTPEEEAAWQADRKMQAEFDNSAERVRRIVEIFE
jgi:hypothetical protein